MQKSYTWLLLMLLCLPLAAQNVDLLIRRAVDKLADDYLAPGQQLYSRATVTINKIENVSRTAADNHIGQALQAQLISALHDSMVFRYIDREHLEEVLAELRLAVSEVTETNNEIRIGNISTVALIITGEVFEEAGDFVLTLQLMDVVTTAVRGTARVLIGRETMVAEADQYNFKYIMANGLGVTAKLTPHHVMIISRSPLVPVGDDKIHGNSGGATVTYRLSRNLKVGLDFNFLMADLLYDDRSFAEAQNIPAANKTDAYVLDLWDETGSPGIPDATQVAESSLYYTQGYRAFTFAFPVSYVLTPARSFNVSVGLGPALTWLRLLQTYDNIPSRLEGGVAFNRYVVVMDFLGAGIFANLEAEYFILPRLAINGGLSGFLNWVLPSNDPYAYSTTNGEAYYSDTDVSLLVFGLNPYYAPDGDYIPENLAPLDHFKIYLGVSLYF